MREISPAMSNAWDFYFARVNDLLASIAVDLGVRDAVPDREAASPCGRHGAPRARRVAGTRGGRRTLAGAHAEVSVTPLVASGSTSTPAA